MSDRFDHTFDTRVETKADEACEQSAHARRIELITGTARRRDWSDDDKARIIVQSLAPGANISAVARRHGIKPQQLFGWRRAARELFREGPRPATAPFGCTPVQSASAAKAEPPVPTFAPVVIAPASAVPARVTPASLPAPSQSAAVEDDGADGVIEIAIGGSAVRVGKGVDAATLATVLAAVRRSS